MKRPLAFVVIGLAISATILAQPFRLVIVNGTSMCPSYESGQVVLAKRSTSGFERGEAVVFRQDGDTLVKRVAFLPGDKILQFWYLNRWVEPQNDFLLSRMRARHIPSRYVAIPADHLYVLGDNFAESVDSRTFGPIPTSSVIGRVLDDPRPECISGFSGAAEVANAGSSLVTYRSEPLSKVDLSRIKPEDR